MTKGDAMTIGATRSKVQEVGAVDATPMRAMGTLQMRFAGTSAEALNGQVTVEGKVKAELEKG